ncbi:LysR substrate-binding domain-containing protein [Shewanella intestini]|uniref:LysR family transcriptional regulator n=1 Tax=Shewanella intestini TaxID=2017544 RepID=A0ABS5I4Z1_9GAMM|nr:MULTISPECIES: LysR substrate-binding domain-containing protein [Shewanella]MBR9729084.1 LysR family transcriptional regulator [Shewanella intestini]MRG37160.1 LysR family transcriptional regulator [Shewanella sp. XMDDZSB0408]
MLTRSDDLHMLLAVIDSGGFSAAAEALDVQVARVSRAVTKVERQLGVSILIRTTRRIELTDEGKQFVDTIRNGLDHIQQAEQSLIMQGELPRGRLRVDAASPFVFHQLVPLIAGFNQAYPDIQIDLSSNEGFVDLLEKRTDVAIRIGELTDSTLHARALGKSELYIVAAPNYLATHGAPKKVNELAQHDTIGFSSPKILNRWPLKGFDTLTPKITCSNGEAIRQLVLAGNGIACLSGFMVRRDIEQGNLIPLLTNEKITDTGRERINAVYYKSSSVAKRVSAFIDYIKPKLSL